MSSSKRKRDGRSHLSQMEAEYNALKDKVLEQAAENNRLADQVNGLVGEKRELIEHIVECGALTGFVLTHAHRLGLKPSIRAMVASHPDAAVLLHKAVNKIMDDISEKAHGTYTLNHCLLVFGKCLAGSEDLLSLPEGSSLAYDFTIRWAVRFYEEAESRVFWLQTQDFRVFETKTVNLLSMIMEKLDQEQEGFANAAGKSLLDRRNRIMATFLKGKQPIAKAVTPEEGPNTQMSSGASQENGILYVSRLTPTPEGSPPEPTEPANHSSPAVNTRSRESIASASVHGRPDAPDQTTTPNIPDDSQVSASEIRLPDIEIGLSPSIGPLELTRRRIMFYSRLEKDNTAETEAYGLKVFADAIENLLFGIFKAESYERLKTLIESHENGRLEMGSVYKDGVKTAEMLCGETSLPRSARKLYSATASILRTVDAGKGKENKPFDPYSTLARTVAMIDYVQEIDTFEEDMLLEDPAILKYLEENNLKLEGDLISVIGSLLAKNLAIEKAVFRRLRTKCLPLWTLSQKFGRGIVVVFAVGGNLASHTHKWSTAETEQVADTLMETLPEFREICSLAESNILTPIEKGLDLMPVQESNTIIGLFSGRREDQTGIQQHTTAPDDGDELEFDGDSSNELKVNRKPIPKKRTKSKESKHEVMNDYAPYDTESD
ncbi:hypothetical protein HYFRA_00012706 [Hymenoscyphus fraxineus]|uniref:Uncharacterized protein n=1 Tax=Hymenoscyphus fraxineus TaxID=746836 RepID=A0A9N9PMT0_9HELO|nr:hypothetical protein HYFRA_00012706 [Hymenoscyphus fraxineus]